MFYKLSFPDKEIVIASSESQDNKAEELTCLLDMFGESHGDFVDIDSQLVVNLTIPEIT